MAEHLTFASGTKAERYAMLLPQIEAVMEGETDLVANMANVAAMLWETFAPSCFPQVEQENVASAGASPRAPYPWMWVGFYRVVGEELVLGPFQGPLACTRIKHGRGVCGTAWAENRTLLVSDVELFPGHIACSSASRSEIVVPVRDREGHVRAVLDIDSREKHTFDSTDREWLERIADLFQNNHQFL